MGMRLGSDGNEPVVSLGLSFFRLFRLDDSEQASTDEASAKCSFVHQNESIQRIAVFPFRTWNGTEIEGKNGPRRQNAFQNVSLLLQIESKLISRTAWRIDDDVQIARLFVEWGKSKQRIHAPVNRTPGPSRFLRWQSLLFFAVQVIQPLGSHQPTLRCPDDPLL